MPARNEGLGVYNKKRNFKKTSEPVGKKAETGKNIFVIQKHDASHLHYDFRLELDGALKSWAVPKGPSLNPHDKRLAMQVEDHPIEYAKFEGIIPAGEYGGGEVIVWDYGTWKPVGDARAGYKKGRLEFELVGKKLHGKWVLVRTRGGEERAQWLLMKRTDEAALSDSDTPIIESDPQSARSGKYLTRDQEALGVPGAKSIAKRAKTWHSKEGSAAELRAEKKTASPKTAKKEITKKKTSKKKARASDVRFLEPQLATLVDAPPVGERWIHEIKYDGYRTLCRVRNGDEETPILYTRKGLDWSKKYESLFGELSRLPVESACLDGEIVATDEEGRSDFSLLQAALRDENGSGLTYYVFDLLELDGRDLRDLPLIERKEILKGLFEKADGERVRYSDHWEGKGGAMLSKSCELGLEGMISKDKFAASSAGRSQKWVKSKCIQGQEVIVVGYTQPEGRRVGFGSLVLAANSPEGDLLYLGRVGTGFDQQKIIRLLREMKPHRTSKSPFEEKVPLQNEIQWLKPKLVAEIFFHGWTGDGHVRQAVFRDLRKDKPASEVTVDYALPSEKLPRSETTSEKDFEEHLANEEAEKPMKKSSKKTASKKSNPAETLALSNPDKILIPKGKVTKKMIRDYLVAVSPWILPHVTDRPLALVRCPDNVDHQCFFQKNLIHRGNGELKTVTTTDPKGKRGSLIYIDSERGLESLAQMGVIEIHAWGTHLDHPLKPDLLVFDLDPDDSVKWLAVATAALRLKEILDSLGLESFLKVSGNKGLHIHVPIEPTHTWEEAKTFANAVSLLLVDENPELYLANMSKAKRKGKIFIDYLRNGYGATSVAPYSLRTKNNGVVAMPIEWSEVKKVDPQEFTIAKALKILAKRKPEANGDPWKGYFSVRQELPKAQTKSAGRDKSNSDSVPRPARRLRKNYSETSRSARYRRSERVSGRASRLADTD